jgi:hypothetical protein
VTSLASHGQGFSTNVKRSSKFGYVLPGYAPSAWHVDPAAISQRCSSVSRTASGSV